MPEIVVFALEGRTDEQKRALFSALTDAMVTHFGAPREAVTVSIVETPRKNKAKGGIPYSDMTPTAEP